MGESSDEVLGGYVGLRPRLLASSETKLSGDNAMLENGSDICLLLGEPTDSARLDDEICGKSTTGLNMEKFGPYPSVGERGETGP